MRFQKFQKSRIIQRKLVKITHNHKGKRIVGKGRRRRDGQKFRFYEIAFGFSFQEESGAEQTPVPGL